MAQLAEDQVAFPGGAAWIACEGLEGEAGLSDLWTRVATALGLEAVKTRPDPQMRRVALAQALAKCKRVLLALDNIEPGLDAEAVLETLAVRGHTALLLTARHKVAPLRLKVIELTPLPQPDAEKLLVERLHQVDASRPTVEEMPAIPALLEALGGLPLALEVTAAYAGIQRRTLQQVADELKADGLSAQALRADPKRAPLVRFERSWKVLTVSQQQLFAGLSLQAGASFPREVALAVAKTAQETTAPATAAPDPAGDLGTLVNYALVEALPGGQRLRLHLLLREFSEHKLGTYTQAEHERLGDTLVAYWLDYARVHPSYEGMDALEAEAEGLMGMLAWAHKQARHREVLGLAHALEKAWEIRGRRAEQLLMYRCAEQAAKALGDLEELQWAIHHSATMEHYRGHREEARAGYERSLGLARQLGKLVAEQEEIHDLALLDRESGRPAEAREGFEMALNLARQLHDKHAEQAELRQIAILDEKSGDLTKAREMYEKALALARELGDPVDEYNLIYDLAVLDGTIGRNPEGRAGYERALAMARQLDDAEMERQGLHALALLDGQVGRFYEARSGYERALAMARQLGDLAAEREEIHGLAVIDYRTGQFSEAQAGYEQALALARQLGDPAAEAYELLDLGDVLMQQGELTRGRKMMMESLALNEQLGNVYEIGYCHQFIASLDKDEGNNTDAITHFREALRRFEQLQVPEAEEVLVELRRLEGSDE